MKIQITNVGKGWKPANNPDADPLYAITIAGQSEPQKTYDTALAVPGEHEAETFQSKTGKTYWRTPKQQSKPSQTQFIADPVKQESIEWQTALKAAVEAVKDWNQMYGMVADKDAPTLSEYKKEIVEAVVTFTQTIEKKPDSILKPETAEKRAAEIMKDMGDFAQVAGLDYDSADEPPIESYNEIPY